MPKPADYAAIDTEATVLVVGTVRTGTNFLIDLLNLHPDCHVGHEIFASTLDHIPWYLDAMPDYAELSNLRASQPIKFIEFLFSITRERGHRVTGFKFLYFDGDCNEQVRDFLVACKNIRVIHLKRRNLLRRLVSMLRAQMTDQWYVLATDKIDVRRPSLRLTREFCYGDFHFVERKQAEYDEKFKDHKVLEIWYEDLAKDPHTMAHRCYDFLGLTRPEEIKIITRKMATDTLHDAIENYEELKADFVRWSSFFEE